MTLKELQDELGNQIHIVKGLKCLLQGKLEVEVLDAVAQRLASLPLLRLRFS